MTSKPSSVASYLQEISRVSLLTREQEIELARSIVDLRELESSRTSLGEGLGRVPTELEWALEVGISLPELRRRLQSGRKAKDKMVCANLRLVVSIAKKYLNRGLSLLDLIQEGSLGLIKASEKFAPEYGYKFSTYATWWIREAITKAIIAQSRAIRLPGNIWAQINRIKTISLSLCQSLGRNPTEQEIAAAMEISIEQLRFILRAARNPTSLDRPIGKKEDATIGDFIEAETKPWEETLLQQSLLDDVNKLLETLSPDEAELLRLRYGINHGNVTTVQELAQKFNLSRDRIRKIEAKALRKLRRPNQSQVLREYLI